MIPEFTAVVTSITTQRPGTWNTYLGRFEFRHIQSDFFHNYHLIDLGSNQSSFIATPEKALLDLIYLVPGSHKESYLTELRLHFPEQFNLDSFISQSERSKSYKLIQAAHTIQKLFVEEKEYKLL
jgi:hypothetical protein